MQMKTFSIVGSADSLMFFLVAKFLVDGTALKITYILEYLVKTYLNEHISLYKMALGYLIIFLQYGEFYLENTGL